MNHVLAIAQMIYDDPRQNYTEHICYQFNVTEDWVAEHAREICETLMDLFGVAYAKFDDGFFIICEATPNLYVFTKYSAQIVGVVQAWDIDDAKRKIPCEYDTLELVDGDVYYDQY